MSDKKYSCSQGIKMLEDDAANPLPQPEVLDGRLGFEAIGYADSVMQPRLKNERVFDKEDHIAKLMKARRRMHEEGREFDPVLVFWSGRRWILVDGYNRCGAVTELRRHQYAPLQIDTVPVTVLPPCSWRDARLKAEEANVKDKLSLSENEKTENAWKTVVIEAQHSRGKGMSKAEIAQASGVGRATVDRMRAALKWMEEKRPNVLAIDQPWSVVWGWFNGREDDQMDHLKGSEWEKERAADIVRYLRRKHGKTMFSNPTILAMVFDALGPRMPKQLVTNEWKEQAVEWLECDCDHNRPEADL